VRFVKLILKLWLAAMAGTAAVALIARQRLPRVDHPDADEIRLVSIFDGTDLRSTAADFRGGEIWTVFGGTRLDLRRTQMTGAAHLSITTVFGGTDVTVPDSWGVSVSGPTLAAGVETEVTEPEALDAPRLIITARTAFSGLRVTARPVIKAAEQQ